MSFSAGAASVTKEHWDALPLGNDQQDYYDDYYEDEDEGRRRRGLQPTFSSTTWSTTT